MIPSDAQRRQEGKEHAQDGHSARYTTQAFCRRAECSADCEGDGAAPFDSAEVSGGTGATEGGGGDPATAGDGRRRAADRGVARGVGASTGGQVPTDLAAGTPGVDRGRVFGGRADWDALKGYTDDGDLEIDNNTAERALRPITVGRNNWMFFGSDRGGRTAAILMSFMATCKQHHIDPFAYLRDVLARISDHPIKRLDELLPTQWLSTHR